MLADMVLRGSWTALQPSGRAMTTAHSAWGAWHCMAWHAASPPSHLSRRQPRRSYTAAHCKALLLAMQGGAQAAAARRCSAAGRCWARCGALEGRGHACCACSRWPAMLVAYSFRSASSAPARSGATTPVAGVACLMITHPTSNGLAPAGCHDMGGSPSSFTALLACTPRAANPSSQTQPQQQHHQATPIKAASAPSPMWREIFQCRST